MNDATRHKATKGKRTSTWQMLETVRQADRVKCTNFPPEFICGLRGALEAGLSCEEITAFLVLLTGVYEASEKVSGPELVSRAEYISRVMKMDIDILTLRRELARARRESREARRRRSVYSRVRATAAPPSVSLERSPIQELAEALIVPLRTVFTTKGIEGTIIASPDEVRAWIKAVLDGMEVVAKWMGASPEDEEVMMMKDLATVEIMDRLVESVLKLLGREGGVE